MKQQLVKLIFSPQAREAKILPKRLYVALSEGQSHVVMP
jgi:hypothetical protein